MEQAVELAQPLHRTYLVQDGLFIRHPHGQPYLVGEVEQVEFPVYESRGNTLRAEAAIRQAYELFDRYTDLNPKAGPRPGFSGLR